MSESQKEFSVKFSAKPDPDSEDRVVMNISF